MNFIQTEIDRIQSQIAQNPLAENASALMAANQALSWAMDQRIAASPFDIINGVPSSTVFAPPMPVHGAMS